jgi:hypothetical protein
MTFEVGQKVTLWGRGGGFSAKPEPRSITTIATIKAIKTTMADGSAWRTKDQSFWGSESWSRASFRPYVNGDEDVIARREDREFVSRFPSWHSVSNEQVRRIAAILREERPSGSKGEVL